MLGAGGRSGANGSETKGIEWLCHELLGFSLDKYALTGKVFFFKALQIYAVVMTERENRDTQRPDQKLFPLVR